MPDIPRNKKAKTTFQKLTASAPTFLEAVSKNIAEKAQQTAVPNAARSANLSITWYSNQRIPFIKGAFIEGDLEDSILAKLYQAENAAVYEIRLTRGLTWVMLFYREV